jgi:hypothetical protein
MGLSPLAHPLHVGEASELMLVLRFAYPAALTLSLTGVTALWLGAELLMPPIARVGIEQLSAMHALTLIRLGHQLW